MAVRSVVVAAGGALALTALTLIPIGEVAAAPFTVTNANASGAGSLAQALIDAAGNAEADVITFDPATNGVTIPGGANINNDDVTLDGNGVGVTIIAGTVNVNSGGSGVTANAVVSDLTAEDINVNSGNASTTTATFTNVTVTTDGINVNSGFGSSTTATFSNVTVAGGNVNVNSGFNQSSTTATFTNLIVEDDGFNANSLDSTTTVTVVDSTIQAIDGTAFGANGAGTTGTVQGSTFTNGIGGVDVTSGATVSITNSTISGFDGDGIAVVSGSLTLQNVTVADVATVPQEEGVPLFVGDATVTLGNTVLVGGGNTICVGGLPTSLGGNVADDTSCGLTATGDQQGVNPLLGALANNGGPTMTHLPGAGSPAIDGGVATGCPAADQRGVARPQDGNNDSTVACDSGAVEIAGTAPTTTTTTTTTTTAPTTTTTAAPTTTTAPAPTTTTTLPAVLPPTGSGSGSGFAVAALITGAGAGLIILARRRPTHPTN